MSFRSMHDDYLDPDRHLGGGGAADSEAWERMADAAEDMLKALRLFDQWPDRYRQRGLMPAFAAARAAIEKATGEGPEILARATEPAQAEMAWPQIDSEGGID
jgi:hypothetical protein